MYLPAHRTGSLDHWKLFLNNLIVKTSWGFSALFLFLSFFLFSIFSLDVVGKYLDRVFEAFHNAYHVYISTL